MMRRSSAFGIGSLAARPPTLQVVGGGKGNLGFEVVYNWTVVNNDATTQTLTVTDINGAQSVFSIAYVYFGSTGAFVIDVQNANIGQNSINDVSGHTLRLYSSSVSAGTITTGVANTILYI